MSRYKSSSPRGFTLVEMLVVLGIIGVLVALLTPAIMRVITQARNAAIAVEVNQLATAIESYKQDKGDYPPSFRDVRALIRHLQRCYPKMAKDEFDALIDSSSGTPVIRQRWKFDEGEALVFWLAMTRSDPRYPLGLSTNTPPNPTFKKYFEFDETRLEDADIDNVPAYKAKYCKDTHYLYIDSRSFDEPNVDELLVADTNDAARFAYPGAFANPNTDNWVRPYANDTGTKGMNATSFQIICAGQDGLFGEDGDRSVGNKKFPSGDEYKEEDRDNITNFSNGKTLEANLP